MGTYVRHSCVLLRRQCRRRFVGGGKARENPVDEGGVGPCGSSVEVNAKVHHGHEVGSSVRGAQANLWWLCHFCVFVGRESVRVQIQLSRNLVIKHVRH